MTTSTANSQTVYPFPDRALARAERRRLRLLQDRGRSERQPYAQFFTPASIAAHMASLFSYDRDSISVLDAGAGLGSLSAAVADRAYETGLRDVSFTGVEVDQSLDNALAETMLDIRQYNFKATEVISDYVAWSIDQDQPLLKASGTFDYAIMNPPYFKIHSRSSCRAALRANGVDTSNIYTAFLLLAMRQLREGGELVAITPRSFANGSYFRQFRSAFCSVMSLDYVHLFESRSSAFADSAVLQENVIFRAVKLPLSSKIVFTSTAIGDVEPTTSMEVPRHQCRVGGIDQILPFPVDDSDMSALHQINRLAATLNDLGIAVSTGSTVEFRNEHRLASSDDQGAIPLLQPANIQSDGTVQWPSPTSRRPQALSADKVADLDLLPSGYYVLTKRFTAKEERRRLVAAVTDPGQLPGNAIALENHLNVFHRNGGSLDAEVATGLMIYINSTVVDRYFRLGSGHTQVNASDLRRMPYPTETELRRLARTWATGESDIDQILVNAISALMPEHGELEVGVAQKRVIEAQEILKGLGLPKQQTNERSALTLLALLNLRPRTQWRQASNSMIGVTPIMEFMERHYGKHYAPNTRETIRRATIHQFLAAGMLEKNPDDPQRPINSGRTVYQVTDDLLAVLRSYGSSQWVDAVAEWKARVPSLLDAMTREREMARIPVTLPGGLEITLSPGGQNPLVRAVIEDFCQRFTPAGRVLYVGDADEKFTVWEEDALAELGIIVDSHGKMPDLIVLDAERHWLIVVEAVTSHGPVSALRRRQLAEIFNAVTLGIVYVTAFESRAALAPYLDEISWETEVWLADAPTHLIHFDGERFLGPYNGGQQERTTR